MFNVGHLTGKTSWLMSCTLPTIAALTPPEVTVRIVYEDAEGCVDYDEPWDMVAMGVLPNQITRAFHIAREFRRRGAVVICGGPDVTVCPQRWRDHVDVLIRGEAERIWPQFVRDYLIGNYRNEYHETEFVDLALSPIPDYSNLSSTTYKQYMAGVVQTSRGCPFNCEFCAAIPLHGRKIRVKSDDAVMYEVQQLYDLGFQMIFFADENFAGNRERTKHLLQRLSNWNHKNRHPMAFSTALSIDTAEDDELLRLLAEAGFVRLIVGVETVNRESLEECRKYQNLKLDTLAAVKKFHMYGLSIGGGCMVGFDHDDLSIFQQQYEFFTQAGITNILVLPLQAFDGTDLKKRLLQEGRYREPDPSVDTATLSPTQTFTVIPKQMTVKQLQQGAYWLNAKFLDWEALANRHETFLKNYDQGQARTNIRAPKGKPKLSGLGILLRVLFYIAFRASDRERKTFFRMLKAAKRSAYPNGLRLTLNSYLVAKDNIIALEREKPDFWNVKNPASEGAISG